MKKRFATMALALVMACSMAIPAGAVGVEKSDATVAVVSSPLYTYEATTTNEYDRVAHTTRPISELSSNGYVALRYNGITE